MVERLVERGIAKFAADRPRCSHCRRPMAVAHDARSRRLPRYGPAKPTVILAIGLGPPKHCLIDAIESAMRGRNVHKAVSRIGARLSWLRHPGRHEPGGTT